jgi:hypothetical protein
MRRRTLLVQKTNTHESMIVEIKKDINSLRIRLPLWATMAFTGAGSSDWNIGFSFKMKGVDKLCHLLIGLVHQIIGLDVTGENLLP